MKHFALLAVLLTCSAFAQTLSGEMAVNVPFPFVVAGEALPAGHYIVRDLGNDYLRISNSQTTGAIVSTHGVLRLESDGSKLVFRCYEGGCFLASVWTTGQTRGHELFPSRPERELAQRSAQTSLAVVRPLK